MPKLYPHQQKALDQLDNGKILWGGVGTGKSRVAAMYYLKKEADAEVIVITTAKKRDSLDWEREFANIGVGKHLNATVAGALTVDSWNNIGKYRDVRGAFFIFDEQRLVGSGQWSSVFIRIARANRWILLSATPGDTWMDYIPVFIANGFYKNRTQFKRDHVVYNTFAKFPKIDRYVDVGRLTRLRNSLLVEMPYLRHTTREVQVLKVQHDKQLLEQVVKKRWHVYENRPCRDVAELFSVMRKVVNSDSTRIQAILTLLKEHPRLIVFYNFNYELEALRTALGSVQSISTTSPMEPSEWRKSFSMPLLKNSSETFSKKPTLNSSKTDVGLLKNSTSPLTLAEWNGHKHQEIPQTDSWVYLVQYTAGAEGWNCTFTDAMCFFSLTYSYKQWHQAFGRIDRMNTPFSTLYYYILMSNSAIDLAVSESLKKKQNFNEGKLKENLRF